jgi:hypothetical protein
MDAINSNLKVLLINLLLILTFINCTNCRIIHDFDDIICDPKEEICLIFKVFKIYE